MTNKMPNRQIFGAKQIESDWHNNRDSAGLLLKTSSEVRFFKCVETIQAHAQPLSQMLRYGCTRLEIGVQSVYEDVARDTNRGHTVRAVSESFHLAKDAGFKVVAHMMPDLPNVGIERDMEQFKVILVYCARRSGGVLTHVSNRNTSKTQRFVLMG